MNEFNENNNNEIEQSDTPVDEKTVEEVKDNCEEQKTDTEVSAESEEPAQQTDVFENETEVSDGENFDSENEPQNNEATYTPEFASNGFSQQFKSAEGEKSFGYNGASRVVIPELTFTEPRPEKVKNRGLKVFCALLALVVIIAASASAGYLASEYSTGQNTAGKAPTVGLSDRPDSDKEIAENYSKAAESVQKSVVSILVYGSTQTSSQSSASGVVYSKDGYIVTNDHIYDGVADAKFLVRLYNGKEYKASYVAGDTRSDLAVIKLDDSSVKLTPAEFGDSNQIVVGESVIALGYPSSYGDDYTLTHGIISAVNRRVSNTTTNYASSFIQTDAALNPGSSGGALCNMYGQVIGITSSKLAGTDYDAVSYAIPTTTMKRVVTSLIKDKCVSDRAKLGITYSVIDTISAEQSSLPVGVYINTISSDSDMYDRGISEGDVITQVNGTAITSSDVLLNVIENSKAGDSIQLTVYSAKKKTEKTYSVKLGADKGSSSYNNESTEDDSTIFGVTPYDDKNQKDNSDNSESSKTFDFPLN